ncbi:hypothetical protein LEP1GSC050_0275 [Leptospira broomii serovar Hurstbridge str. 5399]|uniref:Uncharacterized protein n=1 Tax=Leptospira broomii serovar Hurstbridge str. 5399 TaxID=1049789 RepID=T0F5M7_9LEPT|nr:hypothetical protein LEP1GSC050_0275 [Leptospira broomii serovar Hurstbridge str. 5399]
MRRFYFCDLLRNELDEFNERNYGNTLESKEEDRLSSILIDKYSFELF